MLPNVVIPFDIAALSIPPLPPLALAILSVVSVALVVMGVFRLTRPGLVAARLGYLQRSSVTLEQLELEAPFTERVVRPLFRGLSRLVMGRMPQSQLDELRRRLTLAGNPGGMEVRDFLGLKGLCSLGGGLITLLFFTGSAPLQDLLLVGAGVLLGFLGPNFWLGRRVRARQKEIQLALPDALDLLTICVEAGLGFDGAMGKVAEKWDNALSREFDRVLVEMRMGKSRRDSLRGLLTRTNVADVGTFVSAIIQADQLGVTISRVLANQAEQMRIRRRQRAEELAHKAPVKMVFPMVFLIFPAMWVIILGPAIPGLIEGLGGR